MTDKEVPDEKLIELLEQLSISAHGNGLYLEDIKAKSEEEKGRGDKAVEEAIKDIDSYVKSLSDKRVQEATKIIGEAYEVIGYCSKCTKKLREKMNSFRSI